MSRDRRVYGGRWRRVRAGILVRDGGLCQIKGPGCTTAATDVDHIIPTDAGGDWYDAGNLRAACRTCNQKRKVSRGSRNWQSGGTDITLVIGPPSADLLAYARQHAGPNDLVVDQQQLERTLGSNHGAAKAARNALLTQLRQAKLAVARAWITSHNPEAELLFPHHRVVEVTGELPAGGAAQDATNEEDHRWRRRRGAHPQHNAAPSRDW